MPGNQDSRYVHPISTNRTRGGYKRPNVYYEVKTLFLGEIEVAFLCH